MGQRSMMRMTRGAKFVLAVVAACLLAMGLGTTTAAQAVAQPVSNAADCAALLQFAQEPVPVVKSADGQNVPATVRWGYNADHNICYLVLDDSAIAVLRTAATPPPPDSEDQGDSNTEETDDDKGSNGNDGGETPLPTPQPSPVSAGDSHTCWLKADATVFCWGSNWNGQLNAPDGQFTEVSAGWAHTCALQTDQTIACWGSNQDLEGIHTAALDAPEGRFAAVSASIESWFTCGLHEDGIIQCWGSDENPYGSSSGVFNIPGGRFTSVSTLGNHVCGLRESGQAECWGWSSLRPSEDVGPATGQG